MNEKTIKAIKDALAPLANKIGRGAELGWEAVVKQQIVESYLAFLWGGLLLAFNIVGFVMVVDADKKDWGIEYLGITLLFLMTSISMIVFLDTAISKMANPEFHALEFFLSLGKKES